MLKREKNLILVFILFFVSLVLISAFVIEYGFDHQPCKLCLYERIPYFLSILLIIKILFIKKYERVTLLALSLIFIGSAKIGRASCRERVYISVVAVSLKNKAFKQ